MRSASTVWADPRYEAFVHQHPGVDSGRLWRLFAESFGKEAARSLGSFRQFAARIRGGGHVMLDVDLPDVNELELQVPWKTVLVTADYQTPYFDEDLVRFAYDLGAAWDVEGHVINADLFDMASMSKFPAQIFGERVALGTEMKLGRELINESKRRHKQVAVNTGNHEWRLLVRLLHGELDQEQARDLLVGEGVHYTSLSYLWLGYDRADAVRITHPRSQSVIAGVVGADIARNHDCHVIVAHDHLLAQRRSHSGRWTVTHSGMMAKPGRLMYAVTADDRRPKMTQGFVIVHPDSKTGQPRIRLIDALNVDRELEFWTAKRAKRLKAA